MSTSLKTTRLCGAAVALALSLLAATGHAQPQPQPHDAHRKPQPHQLQQKPQPHHPQQRAPQGPHAPAAHQAPGHGGPQAHGPRGAGPDHSFRKGNRLPSHYRSQQYVVNDWRGHGLPRPSRGHHWVQTGSDYVLVAVATGLIAQIVLH